MKRFIVKFNGGLGNQMFQYAFAKGIQEKTGLEPVFDMSFFKKRYARPFELGVFSIKPNEVLKFSDKLKLALIWKFRRKLEGKKFLSIKLISENDFGYCDYEIEPECYIEGFFQSEKYFPKDIRNEFVFKDELDKKNEEVAQLIKNSNSISLHVRRCDYVKKKRYQNMFATCSLDYYKNALELITKGQKDFRIFVFSDDKEWVKENLKLSYETYYVDLNSGKTSFRDMQLMSFCKHNIIANSSFSWWGAYLNKNPEKIVVAPKKWFNDDGINQKDIIPESWFRIDN